MIRKVKFIFLLFMLSRSILAQNKLPQVNSGHIDRLENFKSNFVSSRNVDIWLPEDYSASTQYAVLYMHDGQMLFDPKQTWNKQAWNIDDVASELMKSMRLNNFIVVGIWNGGETRHADYFPQKPFERLTKTEKDSVLSQLMRAEKTKETFIPNSDLYLQFIVKELKPYIDKHYSVFTNKEKTFIAGSSMGGLISLYAICEYPKIFGGAACLSTHWVGSYSQENNPIPGAILNYLQINLPDPKNHKIYFDCGNQTLDALYPSIQLQVDQVMKRKGFNEDSWMSKYFPGDDHSEKSWSKRLHVPLLFLLGK